MPERNKYLTIFLMVALLGMTQCAALRKTGKEAEQGKETTTRRPEPGTQREEAEKAGDRMAVWDQVCAAQDTIRNIMIHKAEATISYQGDNYEVTLTLFAVKDSIIYISAVYAGFEIIRASVEKDCIKVIDRMNRILYRTPLYKDFGYEHPVKYRDLQCVVSKYFLCRESNRIGGQTGKQITYDFDEDFIKKRIVAESTDLELKTFEFHHQRTNEYVMGERTGEGIRIYSNFMIGTLEVQAQGGTTTYNQDVDVRMDVNPDKYTFIELQ